MATLSSTASPDASHPLWPQVVPCNENRNDAANVIRLLYYCGSELVVVLPEETDPDGTEAAIYGVKRSGMLSRRRGGALVKRAGTRYAEDCKRELGERHPDYQKCLDHANQMRGKFGVAAVRAMMTAVVVDLSENGLLPPDVMVRRRDEIDADLTCVGTPGGVLDLLEGRILPLDEARERLVLSSTEVEYDPKARHPRVDEILPPLTDGIAEMDWYRAAILGYGLTHAPAREFLWEICAARSGKTTFGNTVAGGLGRAYVRTIRRELFRPDRFASASSHSGDLRHLAKPVRFAFVREIQGQLDSEIIKAASGGDGLGMRRIRLEDEEIEVTAHVWFMGNSKLKGGPRLDIGDDDESAQAIMDRVKPLHREPIANPDKTVVKLKDPSFKRAALARLVEYTKACSKMRGFPPAPLSSRLLLEAQRQAEMADWERDWVPTVLWEKGAAVGLALPACSTQVKLDFDLWWEQHQMGERPDQSEVSRKVVSHYSAVTKRQYCRSHKITEHCYLSHVMARPISLIP